MSERAADRFTIDVVAKKRRMLFGLFQMLMGDQNVTPPEDEIQVTDRASGQIVHREAVDEGPGVDEYKAKIQRQLETMDVDAFCAEYNITP